ncbi:MAG TPA: hypothetical protein VGJ20_03865 [Xanthobacteraceae bacterium]
MFFSLVLLAGYRQVAKLNREIRKMFSKTKVALSAAIVLSAAFPASAATKHHRVTFAHLPIYNMDPTHARPSIYNMDPGDGSCSPIHPPLCSNICTGPGPCAPPDGW